MEIVVIVALLIFGLLLLLAEVIFVPGTTFVGLIGLVFSGIAIYLTFNNYGDTIGWMVLGGNVVIFIGAIIYGLKAEVWKRFSLQTSITSRVNSEKIIQLTVGDVGKTLSDLRPIGNAEFNDQVIEVKTLGNFINARTPVKITRIDGNNIFVETLITYS